MSALSHIPPRGQDLYPRRLLISLSLLILYSTMFIGCQESNRPSDHEMQEHFARHEGDFEELRQLIEEGLAGNSYPPYSSTIDTDSLEDAIRHKLARLDSLLGFVDIERVYYTGTDADSAYRSGIYARWIYFPYYSSGLSITGCTKGFIYAPGLSRHMDDYNSRLRQDPGEQEYLIQELSNKDLDDLSSRYNSNLELYRPLGGDWYIYFERDN